MAEHDYQNEGGGIEVRGEGLKDVLVSCSQVGEAWADDKAIRRRDFLVYLVEHGAVTDWPVGPEWDRYYRY